MFGKLRFQQSTTILLVEDQQSVVNEILPILRSQGYRVLQAQSAKTALEIGSQIEDKIDLLVTEAALPGLYGWELAELLKLDYPQLHVLYITSRLENDADEYDSETQEWIEAADQFLRRPFGRYEVIGAVRRALDSDAVAVAPWW